MASADPLLDAGDRAWKRAVGAWPRRFGVALLSGIGLYLGVSNWPQALFTRPPASLATSAKYTRVQYLGFQIFTPPGTGADGCFGADIPDEDCYLGSPKVAVDLKARFNIMRAAVENAHASSFWDRGPSTLKVFSAPEFYWRGARGAYRVGHEEQLLIQDFTEALEGLAAQPKYSDWVFVFGTLVLAEHVDASYLELLGHPYANISFYNVAPIYIGGTSRRILEFKHYISGVDFIQHSPGHQRVQPIRAPPGSGAHFCATHPESNGCVYGALPDRVARQIGFHAYEVVKGNVFELGGLRVGIEVCLDHAEGRLSSMLAPEETVDVHLITAAGMSIPRGPVCTPAQGPVFLSDGFADTAMSFNEFGRGRVAYRGPGGGELYEVGLVYESTALRSLQQWLGDSISVLTGNAFGGESCASLPGGSVAEGKTGIQYNKVNALGARWLEMLQGFFDTASYEALQKAYPLLRAAMPHVAGDDPFTFPTVDFYGPVPLR